MARIWSCGFELQSVTTGMEYEANLDTPAISTSIFRGGLASLECSGSLTNTTQRGISHTFGSNMTAYYRVAMYIDSLDANVRVFVDLLSGASKALSISITDVSGTLTPVITYNAGANTLTNTAVVAYDTWHVWEMYYNSADAGANDDITVWLDNVQVGITTTASLSLAPAVIALGIENNSGSTVTGSKAHFDDIAINNTSGSEAGRADYRAKIVHMQPDGAGDNTQWQDDASAVQGTAVVGNINEVTPDDATNYNKRTTNAPNTQPIDDWTVESSSSAGIGSSDVITLVAVGGRIGATSNTATNRNGIYRIKSASGGTTTSSSTIDWSFNGWRTNVDTAIPLYQLTSYTDPTTGVAWTPTGTNSLDNMQIGVQAGASSTNEIRYSALWALVEYIPSVGIQFDAASNSGYQAASSSYSWSHTCTGSDRYLVVGVAMLSLAQTVSSITYNSVNLTLLGTKSSISGAARVELWGLVAPATGSNTIAVTLSGSIASAADATSLTGVHQTSPTEGFNSAQATNVGAADATVDVTTVADNDWAIDIVATDDTAITVGAGQTQRGNVTGVGGSGAMSTEGPKTPAGTVTMSWTDVGALATWAIGAIGIRPTAAASLSSVKDVIGVGVVPFAR